MAEDPIQVGVLDRGGHRADLTLDLLAVTLAEKEGQEIDQQPDHADEPDRGARFERKMAPSGPPPSIGERESGNTQDDDDEVEVIEQPALHGALKLKHQAPAISCGGIPR